ncbi:RBM43 protein, partial [Rhinopomastus cyanomelas]|nr:RBM43 protein [Rhinopomastus cyanomelas]
QVFSSVTSLLDMAIFKDKFVLEDLVQEMKGKSTALSFGPLQPNGLISVQGSFPAIEALRDFLLLKAKSLSTEDKKEESRSHQRQRRRPQQRRVTTDHDVHGERQEVILDTDVYHYMKRFFPRILQVNGGVLISNITNGDTTIICIEGAESRSNARQVLRVKEKIETWSVKLYNTLRKERICFGERSSREKERYKSVCERLKPRFPYVLIIPCDTHIDIIGNSSDIFEFTKRV